MSREIEELRGLAQKERAHLRAIGGELRLSAVAEVRGRVVRHRRTALAVAVGIGFTCVRVLSSGSRRVPAPHRGLARASLGALLALAVKVLPSAVLQAVSAKGDGRTTAAPPSQTPNPGPKVAAQGGAPRVNADAATTPRSPVPTPAP